MKSALHLEDEQAANSLRALAEQIMDARQRRQWFFARAAFGEVAWEILLLLYSSETNARSLGSLAAATSTSLSTGERWARYLEGEGLVTINNGPGDLSQVEVRLTRNSVSALELYLADTRERLQARGLAGQPPPTHLRSRIALTLAVILAAALASAITYALKRG